MDSYHRQIMAMGTRLDIVFPGLDLERGELLYELIRRELERLEGIFSRFDPDSELRHINEAGAGSELTLSPDMDRILHLAKSYSNRLNGYFDITLAPHINELKEGKDSQVHLNGMDRLLLSDGSIIKRDPALSLDLGGIGKGYALENINRIIQKAGISTAFISFGESSVYVHGKHPFGDSWKVSLMNPDGSGQPGHTFELTNSALSVSGNTRANREKFGTWGHICYPHTGKMRTELGLVAVLCSSPLEAEVLSTALFSAGEKQYKTLLDNFPGSQAVWISPGTST